MSNFSQKSLDKLATCHPDLQLLFNTVIKTIDCTILEGHRGEAAQNKAYTEGKSQLKYPHGNHNANPSNAVDVIPYPIDWNDRERLTLFAGFVLGVAEQLKAQGKITSNIVWGGDWNKNFEVKDNNFDDLVHFERK